MNAVEFAGEEEGVTDAFLPGGVGRGRVDGERVLGVDLGEILRAAGRLFAVSFTRRRPGREEAPISQAGGAS